MRPLADTVGQGGATQRDNKKVFPIVVSGNLSNLFHRIRNRVLSGSPVAKVVGSSVSAIQGTTHEI